MTPDDRALAAVLLDKIAIRDCVARTVRALDRQDDALFGAAFADDARIAAGAFDGPVAEYLPWANARHSAIAIAYAQNLTSHISDIAGDRAQAQSYAIFVLTAADGQSVHIGGGRLLDRLERRAEGWRIVERQVMVEWQGREAVHAAALPHAAIASGAHNSHDPSYAMLGQGHGRQSA